MCLTMSNALTVLERGFLRMRRERGYEQFTTFHWPICTAFRIDITWSQKVLQANMLTLEPFIYTTNTTSSLISPHLLLGQERIPFIPKWISSN